MTAPTTLWEVLSKLKVELEGRDQMNRREWNLLLAMRDITTSRRTSSHLFEVFCTAKVLVPINGTTWKVDHDRYYDLMGKCNPGNNHIMPEVST